VNDRDIETEIGAFFRRTVTPEPSAHLRAAVAKSRLAAPAAPRRRLFGTPNAALSVLGLAAAFIVAFGFLFVVIRGGGRTPASVGPSTGVSWQTGDLSLPAASAFAQFVPIGDMLFLIESHNGTATQTASAGIWASAEGIRWPTLGDIDSMKSPASVAPIFTAASPNGRGGAVVVGSDQTIDGTERTAAWWTVDGRAWERANVAGPAGRMLGVVARPDDLVAVGVTFSGEAAAWRSTDGGANWTGVSLPGGGRDAVDVTVWGSRFVAIGRSNDASQLLLWTSSDGATWSLTQSPSDPSFAPARLIPFGDTLVVLGHGVPGSAILACDTDLKCARASVPDLGFAASFTDIVAGAEVSGTIVVSGRSAAGGTVANPGSSAAATSGVELWASRDGRNWTTLESSPSPVFVTSNLVVFRGRLVALAVNPDVASTTATVLVGDVHTADSSASPAAASPTPPTTPSPSPAESPSASVGQAGILPCQASSLAIDGVRQGESGIVNLGIAITNTGDVSCMLPQLPAAVQLLDAKGTALDIPTETVTATAGAAAQPVVIAPHVAAAAILTVYWTSWCQPDPGQLRVKVTLPAGAGSVSGPVGQAGMLPRCDTPGRASSLQLDGINAAS